MSYLKKFGNPRWAYTADELAQARPAYVDSELYELHDPAIETVFNDLHKKILDDSLRLMEEQARLIDTAVRAMLDSSGDPKWIPVRLEELKFIQYESRPVDWSPEPGHPVSPNDVACVAELQDPFNHRMAWVFRVVGRTPEGRPAWIGMSLSLSWKQFVDGDEPPKDVS
jgi:hypothetical protein